MPAESKLQKKILADLKKKGWEAVKVTLCNQNGWPDITGYKNKRTVFIEAKAPKKAANPLQQYRHECLRAQGFEVYVCPTWEQYKWIKL